MIVLYIVAPIVGLIVLAVLVGLLLPRDHVATRTAKFDRPPTDVYAALTALQTKRKEPAVVVEVDDAPRRRVTRIADDSHGYGGRWICELQPDNGGTKVSITEDGFVSNPVFRVVMKVMGEARGIEGFLAE